MKKFTLDVEKVVDSRVSRLTKKWCEVLYKAKYGLIGAWGGKEAKQLTELIAYSRSNFGDERAEEKCSEAMVQYLANNEAFVAEKRHPFSLLFTGRAKYFVPDKKPEPPKPTQTVQSNARQPGKVSKTKEQVMDDVIEHMKTDKNYLHRLYLGTRNLKGSVGPTKILKEVVEELLDPKIREMIDEQDRIKKQEEKNFIESKPLHVGISDEIEPDWK